jgi:hypothetical protein
LNPADAHELLGLLPQLALLGLLRLLLISLRLV